MLRYVVAALLVVVSQARPDDGYHAPEESYAAPAEAYGAPEVSYSAPSYAAPAGGLDLTTLLIPILALVGLFLLFPTYVTLTSVRRKREAGEETDMASDIVNRIQDMFMAVSESEECMERVACQVGALAADAGLSRTVAASALMMAPSKYAKYAKQFAVPTSCHKLKCGTMF